MSSADYLPSGHPWEEYDFDGSSLHWTWDETRHVPLTRVRYLVNDGYSYTTYAWHPYWRLPTRIAQPGKLTTLVYHGQTDGNGQVQSCAPADAQVAGHPIGVACSVTEQSTTNLTGSIGFNATPTGEVLVWRYTYNSHGQVLTEDGPRTDVSDITQYTYFDAADPCTGCRGNLASITTPTGKVTRITRYDPHGNPLEIVDPNGTHSLYTYDLRQRLTHIQVGDETTQFTYDGVGQLTRVTHPDGSTHGYDYDNAHRLIAETDAKGRRTVYTLDNAGHPLDIQTQAPGGDILRQVKRIYDPLGRVQEQILP